jgi:L-rhamnose mutarotase
MWDEMYAKLKACGIKIRSIWIADVAHQGQSSVLNENKLGNDRESIATTFIQLRV